MSTKHETPDPLPASLGGSLARIAAYVLGACAAIGLVAAASSPSVGVFLGLASIAAGAAAMACLGQICDATVSAAHSARLTAISQEQQRQRQGNQFAVLLELVRQGRLADGDEDLGPGGGSFNRHPEPESVAQHLPKT